MRKIEYQDFDLTKCKITKEGLDFSFFEKGNGHNEYSVTCEGIAHPDLVNKLDELKEFMAKRLNLLTGWDFAREHLRSNMDLLQEAIKGYDAEVERCVVSGIVFVGSDQLKGIKITGSLKCSQGSFGLATPNITFSSEKLGYEKTVEEICEKIREEVYLYHFKNKRAQQNLMDQAEEFEQEKGEAAPKEEKPKTARAGKAKLIDNDKKD